MDPIYVCGHKNPDTDSVVSAMAYAALHNALGDNEYVAAVQGTPNDESRFLLEKFGFEVPMHLRTVRTQVRDIEYDEPPALGVNVAVSHAWSILQADANLSAVPVTTEDGHLYGMITAGSIAESDMESIQHPQVQDVPVFNLLSALEGHIINNEEDAFDLISGEVVIALPGAAAELRGVKEVRSYNVQREHAALFEEISHSSKSAKLEYMRRRATPQVIYSCAAAFMIGMIFLVCVLYLRMDTARLMVLVYVFMRLWPVFSGLYSKIQSIQSAVPAFEKLNEAFVNLAQPDAPAQDAASLTFEKEIRFENVSFAYQDGEETVLKNVSFTLKKGTITALVGRSGGGKTTIADLLLGFLIPVEGSIRIDGVALTRDNLPSWRRALGYVPQDPLILNASVRENLQRFHPQATEAEMIVALKKAQAWSFVSGLKDGLDTMLGDDGVRLSGGERQRIVMARVLLGRPQLIVMDEATSAMDYESEAAVRAAIRELDKNVTVLVIAHRLATVRTAEYAVVIEDGTVSESGLLKDLFDKPEGYLSRHLYTE